MTARGLDYAWSHVPPQAVKAAGFGFAARYLSHDPSKNLTRPEAQALLAAGVEIVLVWEDTAQGALRGHAGGATDAFLAEALATVCGLPGAFIYFAADFDATPAQQATINDYLDGCATVIGHDRTGLYGGYWPLSRARAAAKASKYWGTLAWSGSNWVGNWQPDVMQGAQVTIDGVSVDLDTAAASGDFGQWPRPVPTAMPVTVPPEEPDMIIFNVDQKSVPPGAPWPGTFLLAADATLHHITSPADLASYQAAGIKEPPPFSYGEYLARGGVAGVPVRVP